MREQLLCYALRYEGDWKKMKLALDRQEPGRGWRMREAM